MCKCLTLCFTSVTAGPCQSETEGSSAYRRGFRGSPGWGCLPCSWVLLAIDTVLFYLIPIMTLQVSFIFPSGKWEKWGLDRLRNFSRVPWPRSDTGGIRKAQSCLAPKLEEKAIGKGSWEVRTDSLAGCQSSRVGPATDHRPEGAGPVKTLPIQPK